MSTFISYSEAETKKIAGDFFVTLRPGDIVTLTGDLGAGKTTFVKGIAAAFGIKKEITSPTFAIMNVYQIPDNKQQIANISRLVHIDTYRLKSINQLYAIGVDEYIGASDSITIIEWPELTDPLLKNKKIRAVELTHNSDTSRKITIEQ